MADRRAVLIPGRGYDTRYPLFLYLGEALRRLGFGLHGIAWQVPEDFDPNTIGRWVCDEVAPTLTERTDLLVGKSLGSLAAPLAVERRLPAVWLTPLLHRGEVVDALRRSTAPFLLVGGTADSSWDGGIARRLTPHVLEITAADHALMVPGPLARSAEVLGKVCTVVEDFVR
ncbi:MULTISPECIES: alpha/beta hydrolase [Micromonospora]|uniref:Alpha/beta hydrolase n=1 Tax=Micromonospora craniellae TaxID=2294034 RepID=A0A372G0C5_9ACTN|nr:MULTISPECIES: alpha/beta hydrolase [Micromonospora]QKW11415.1 alpha/beta hydrolase [Verrucosispora sp. NA02020]QOC94620.1 alpha/beta hydrolase [Micromonospora craniellae]RFS46482.1 alpha/beta hydrolase [Micromonospora craniellae]TBL42254.1 alpha/beta hydrolase [Verrucosispora sp. SN26_14.1]